MKISNSMLKISSKYGNSCKGMVFKLFLIVIRVKLINKN